MLALRAVVLKQQLMVLLKNQGIGFALTVDLWGPEEARRGEECKEHGLHDTLTTGCDVLLAEVVHARVDCHKGSTQKTTDYADYESSRDRVHVW